MKVAHRIALYHSLDKKDEEYWDIAQTAKTYDIRILKTDKKTWGGECVFEVTGESDNLNKFAREFCSADDISELFVKG
jgi:hypothetical protein